MADVALTVTLSRDLLGLSPLEIANDPVYYCSPQFLGSVVEWDRQQVSSRWQDGDVTTSRRRRTITEHIGIEVKAPTLWWLQQHMKTLIDAFIQDSFTMTVVADTATRAYACEAADYQDLSWTTPRLAVAQGQLLFSVPRSPVPVLGYY